jgi:hypothetical protein
MEHSIYGFHYDYIRHRGTCLVLSRTDTLRYEHFERIELRMMEANEIPGLLTLESEEIDLIVKLRYEITGKRMLSQWMKTGRFTLEDYYRFLLKCAGTIDDSKTYMLREDGYWLHEHFMFIDGDSPDEPMLVYVPIRIADAKPSAREQFKELALRLSACIGRIEGSGFSSLLSALHRDTFEFHEIRKLLGTLLSSETANEFRTDRNENLVKEIPTVWQAASESGPDIRMQAPSWINAGSEYGDSRQEQAPGILTAEANDSIDPGQHAAPNEREPLTGRQRLLGGAAAGAGLLLLWSFYPPEAEEGLLSIWTGLTLLMLDALFVWVMLRPNWPGKGKLHALAQTYTAMEEREMTGLTSYLSVPAKNQQTAVSREAEVSTEGVYERSTGLRAEAATPPRRQDATVLLRPEALAAAGQPAEQKVAERLPELEAHKGGAVERIRLTRDRFVIGREQGMVDYTEETAGVSKLHLEIVREHSEYFAKDLGSKNGTLWNNEPMVPYKWYPLKDGASLQVVNTRFVFLWDHAE